MEKTKFDEKTNEILIWLDANDAGALEPLIRMNIEIGQACTDEEELERYWASIRSLCGNMEKNPVRRGSPSKHSPETLANVDAVESRLITAFLSIDESELVLDIFHPRQTEDSQGHYDLESWAAHMAASGKRYMMLALNENRWDGELTDNLTNMALKEPKAAKTTTEAPSDE